MSHPLGQLSATEIAAALQRREFSAREVAQAFLDVPDTYGAFLHVDAERTLAEADAAQARLDAGETSPLLGVPVAIKDNISTQGRPTTCASRILEGYIPPYDATVISQLHGAGMPLLGKTNLDEFAMGTSTENSAYAVCKNPWDTTRSPGGSSGGSAAAVSGGLAPISLGSDTGGSIRQPASLCGLVGFKPTYGRVSRFGLVAFGSSLDQIGPFGQTVADVAAISQVICQTDGLDNTSLPDAPLGAMDLANASVKGKRFALPRELMSDAVDANVRASIEQAIRTLEAAGATVDHVDLPSLSLGVSTYYVIAPAEASSNLGRFDGVRYGAREEAPGHVESLMATRGKKFGHEVKLRIMVGTYALSAGYYDAYYLRAQQIRGLMVNEIDALWGQYDAILSPTSPCVAFPLGGFSHDPMALKLMDFCTIPANMGGYPALSLPCGLADGLPVGLHLMGPVRGDERLLELAAGVEREMGCAPLRPQFA